MATMFEKREEMRKRHGPRRRHLRALAKSRAREMWMRGSKAQEISTITSVPLGTICTWALRWRDEVMRAGISIEAIRSKPQKSPGTHAQQDANRRQGLALWEKSHSPRSIARKVGVSLQTAVDWDRRWRAEKDAGLRPTWERQ